MGVPWVRYFDMPHDQGAPEEGKMMPVTNPVKSCYDKPKGGLWTSPVESEYAWVDWCKDERTGWLNGSWVLVPSDGVNLLRVDDEADLDAAFARYPLEWDRGHGYIDRNLNFEAMAQDYDGFWLTADGHWATRMRVDKPIDTIATYTWDCETVFWFRWCFESVHAEAALV